MARVAATCLGEASMKTEAQTAKTEGAKWRESVVTPWRDEHFELIRNPACGGTMGT